jgi:hypothetical protein
MSGGHAPAAPSSLFRTVLCAASLQACARHPEGEHEAALEGTAAHWVNEQVIKGTPPTLGTQAPNGIATTREMLEGAAVVIDAFEKAFGARWRELIVVERTVRIPRIHATQCWGTPDYYAWVRSTDGRLWLFVFDYKFGHEVVEVFENEQITAYTVGLIDEAQASDLDVTVVMTVIQPRAYHRKGPVRSWTVQAAMLRAQVNIIAGPSRKPSGPSRAIDPRRRGARTAAPATRARRTNARPCRSSTRGRAISRSTCRRLRSAESFARSRKPKAS